MIEEQELRIGGIFNAEDDFLFMTTRVKLLWVMPPKVLWVSISESNEGTKQEDAIIDLEPIPLTPEILLACGFVKGPETIWKHKDLNGISIHETGQWTNGIPDCDIEYILYKDAAGAIMHVPYVHRLQNIVFELTDCKVELKLPE